MFLFSLAHRYIGGNFLFAIVVQEMKQRSTFGMLHTVNAEY